MRFDAANRAFALLLAGGLAAYISFGLASAATVAAFGYRISTEGLSGLPVARVVLGPLLCFLALVGTGAVMGVLYAVKQIRATRKLSDIIKTHRVDLPDDVCTLVADAELLGRVDLVDEQDAYSFAYGFLRPRVVLSRGLVGVASPRELQAVLHHERHHVRNLDPLKILIARTLPSAFFYLPALNQLRHRFAVGRELAADRRAVERCGPSSLAGALYKVTAAPGWAAMGAAAAIGGTQVLEARIVQLEQGIEPELARIPKRSILVTAAGLGLLMWSAVVALGHVGGAFALIGIGTPAVAGTQIFCGLGCAGAAWHLLQRGNGRFDNDAK